MGTYHIMQSATVLHTKSLRFLYSLPCKAYIFVFGGKRILFVILTVVTFALGHPVLIIVIYFG